MLIRAGMAVVLDFTTQNPATGAAQNNDAGVPTATLSRNGVDDGAVVVTVVNKAVGVYRASFTVPLTYAVNDILSLRANATVNAVAGVGIVWHALVTNQLYIAPGSVPWTHTVTGPPPGLVPIPDVEVDISTDFAGANRIWKGYTDAFGVTRDTAGALPGLDPGPYYFWHHKVGWTPFVPDPDLEVVP